MSLTDKLYTEEDHLVRSTMFAQQSKKIFSSNRVIQTVVNSLRTIPLSDTRVPDGKNISALLQDKVGRTLTDAQGKYLGPQERFTHLLHKRFPVTDYIRPMGDIAFTPLPDLFHEYFGHMPQMFLQEFADMEEFTAKLFFMAKTPEQQKMVYTFSWYSIEYGMLREDGIPKARGAGLLSSPGDLDRVIQDVITYEEATLAGICETATSPHEPHTKLFVFRSMQQVRDMLFEIEHILQTQHS